MCDHSDLRPSLACEAIAELRDRRGLPPAERDELWITNHSGHRPPSASPAVLVVALLAPYLTLSRCEGRVPVLPGQ